MRLLVLSARSLADVVLGALTLNGVQLAPPSVENCQLLSLSVAVTAIPLGSLSLSVMVSCEIRSWTLIPELLVLSSSMLGSTASEARVASSRWPRRERTA